MAWTREKRYRSYTSWPQKELTALRQQAARSPFKPGYHISPRSGLLNDPNGFSYFNGQWHVFYQSYPFGPVHGLKSWTHCVSSDLVHWQDLGLALLPTGKYDSHGAYSGSAFNVGDRLFLAYTGNVRDQTWQRHSYQNGAWLDQDGQITKCDQPLIMPPAHVTEHFRDPQLLKHGENYYILAGAQDRTSLSGQFSWFKSTDLMTWKDQGYLKQPWDALGFMVECPNLVLVDGSPVLIFCPQGLAQQQLKYQNIYPNTYSVGTAFNFEDGKFTADPASLTNLDEGFDVYASQAFNAPNGKAYLISWIGLPEIDYPTDQENWAHCLSLVKELHVKDGQLIQQPVAAQSNLQDHALTLVAAPWQNSCQLLQRNAGQQYQLDLKIDADQQGRLLLAGSSDQAQGLRLEFNTGKPGQFTVDRGHAGTPFAKKYGTTRNCPLPAHQELELKIFIDHSVCEIFVNGGEKVFTLRYFAPQTQTEIAFIGENELKYSGRYYELKNM